MKDITTLIESGQSAQQDELSIPDKHKVKNFVLSVFQLFPNYKGELTDESNIKTYCRIHQHKISKFSDNNYADRLRKAEALISQQNLNGLVGNYKNAIHALAGACGDMERLNHDYRIAFPSNQGGTGALLAIENQSAQASDSETSDYWITKMKADIFK